MINPWMWDERIVTGEKQLKELQDRILDAIDEKEIIEFELLGGQQEDLPE